MSTILNETLLTFTDALQHIPEVGGRPRIARTLYNWTDLGVKVHGKRIKLECARVGGRRVTSVEAIARFIAATSAPETPTEPIRTPHARQKASEEAKQRIEARFAMYAKQRRN